jgi:hypothetical protein
VWKFINPPVGVDIDLHSGLDVVVIGELLRVDF